METFSQDEVATLRRGLAELPRADNHAPGKPIDPAELVPVAGHRAALDPDRALVVGNRGMGKSFWAHALANSKAREKAASVYRELVGTAGWIGFNGSDRTDEIAPTKQTLQASIDGGIEPSAAWRAVILRAARAETKATSNLGEDFATLAAWVSSHAEQVDAELTQLDDKLANEKKRLIIIFDALDHLGSDWATRRRLAKALLERALAARSYRAIRLKLFMRSDQFADDQLFAFPDGSKIRNTRVELQWPTLDLWGLLFTRVGQGSAGNVFRRAFPAGEFELGGPPTEDRVKIIVDALAGPFMGANKKRGRVYTWVPQHLADAKQETSPRTFLTAWREAALHNPPPADRPVDHLGIQQGVRKASEDRLSELKEDYRWIEHALAPLRGAEVPMERSILENRWMQNATIEKIQSSVAPEDLGPVQLESGHAGAGGLVDALVAIGVLETRPNGKINVPDIFRVEAGIKRRGGVSPPKRT